MTPKRQALSALTKPLLLMVARNFELDVSANDSVDEIREAIAQSKKAKLNDCLAEFPRDVLKEICRAMNLDDSGKEKQPIIDRITAKLGGGSTDETPQAIEHLVRANPDLIRGIRVNNSGPGAAREAGRQVAAGEFVQYLDSDDLLLPKKFEMQVKGLLLHQECGVAYGKTRFYHIAAGPQDVAWKRTGEVIATMFPSFLKSRWWDTSTPLYRRAVTDRAGPWLALRNEEDWEYDSRIASQGVNLHYEPAFVSDTRVHGGRMLSAGGTEPAKLRDRAEAHRLILAHAQRAGIGWDTPEMHHFSRELFLLCRQCGAAGLPTQARMLFELAREASGPDRSNDNGFKAYSIVASIIGWDRLGWLSGVLDHARTQLKRLG